MYILLVAITIILILFILLNYVNMEKFTVVNDTILDYLNSNIDNIVLKNSNCYDNDKMIQKIKGNNESCLSQYNKVADVNFRGNRSDMDNDNALNTFFDKETGKSYTFSELCPITSGAKNGTNCLREHNNEISNVMFRLNNIILDTEINMNNKLSTLGEDINNYRTDKYRLFNSDKIQDYLLNN